MAQNMRISVARAVRDALLIFAMTAVPGFIVAFSGRGPAPDAPDLGLGLLLSGFVFGTVGFVVSGYLVTENRWRHIFFVASGVWLLSVVNVLFFGETLMRWVGEAPGILVMGAIGGGIVAASKKIRRRA